MGVGPEHRQDREVFEDLGHWQMVSDLRHWPGVGQHGEGLSGERPRRREGAQE